MVWEFPAVSHTRYDFWKAKQYTKSGMWWFTLVFGALGLHHYMLRSPQTGMIFFLTNLLLFGYPWFYDLVQLSSGGETLNDLNTYGLGHPWGALGLAQGMWRNADEPEITENDDDSMIAGAVAAASAAANAAVRILQKGGGDPVPPNANSNDGDVLEEVVNLTNNARSTGVSPSIPSAKKEANGSNGSKEANGSNGSNEAKPEGEKPKGCPKDEYTAPTPWFFILFNLFVPLSPLAHIIGGNRERAVTRFLYLFAGIIFAVIFTIIFGILWFFLPAAASDFIYSIYPSALALVSLAYLFAVIYDYIIMFVVPSELFFNSKQCNLNGFVGFKEHPPCPSESPMTAVTNVLKPATDIIILVYTYISGAFKGIGSGIYSMTPMGRAEMMAKAAAGVTGSLPGGAALANPASLLAGATGNLSVKNPLNAASNAAEKAKANAAAALTGAPPANASSGSAPPANASSGIAPPASAPPANASQASTGKESESRNAIPTHTGGARTELEPLDYLGGGVIGAVLLGGFILGSFRNVSRREYWLNDSPPNPRGV